MIREELLEAQKVLQEFIASPDSVKRIEEAGALLVAAFSAGNKIISCGNGGSMCDAMHFAEELSGRFRNNRKPLPAASISDPSYLSCVANDYGYDQVFSRYIDAFGKPGDVLLAISTSGNSTNVVEAIHMAKKRGMMVIGLTGKDGGKMASMCEVEIRAPQSKFADRAQEIHIKVIHSLIHYTEQALFGN
jgi:D-sedoheptulose 7-phosphate isomerase